MCVTFNLYLSVQCKLLTKSVYFFSLSLIQKQRKKPAFSGMYILAFPCSPGCPCAYLCKFHTARGEGFGVMCLSPQTASSLGSESLFVASLMPSTVPSRQWTINA